MEGLKRGTVRFRTLAGNYDLELGTVSLRLEVSPEGLNPKP